MFFSSRTGLSRNRKFITGVRDLAVLDQEQPVARQPRLLQRLRIHARMYQKCVTSSPAVHRRDQLVQRRRRRLP